MQNESLQAKATRFPATTMLSHECWYAAIIKEMIVSAALQGELNSFFRFFGLYP
jgi:hypothetical protein